MTTLFLRRPRLVYIVTHPVSAVTLLRGQLAFMREAGFDVTLVTSPGAELERVRRHERVDVVEVSMQREIAPAADAVSLARIVHELRRIRPDVVHASTPKAGLLGMLAAKASAVPVRVYLLRGLRLETAEGLTRQILGVTERVASSCAHDVVCVSESLRRVAVDGGFVSGEKARVLGGGSSNGVDVQRFRTTPELRAQGEAMLAAIGVPEHAPVVGFVGRMVVDKGILELLDAFDRVRRSHPEARLVVVGGGFAGEAEESRISAALARTEGVVLTGAVADPAPLYARMQVLALPSHREGFPNVVLEASAAGIPVVGARSTGVRDAVVDGETGRLVPAGDARALAEALSGYLAAPHVAAVHGRAGRERTVKLFSREAVWSAWRDYLSARLAARGLPVPASVN